MPLLVRTVRQNRWHKQEAEPFLETGDVPADCLSDLGTTQNLLSVWELAQDKSNLERIIRAMAIGRNKLDHIGYVVFDCALLSDAEIEVRESMGCTFDEDMNS